MKRLLLLAVSLLSLSLLAVPAAASAFDTFGNTCTAGQTSSSAVCTDKNPANDPIAGSNGIIVKATTVVAYIAGVAAIILMIIGGIYFVTSGGDSNKVSSARNAITNAFIGLVIIVLARTIIVYIVSKL